MRTAGASEAVQGKKRMPGIIVFRRRWSVGSDDLIIPAGFLVIFHTIWYVTYEKNISTFCSFLLISHFVVQNCACVVAHEDL